MHDIHPFLNSSLTGFAIVPDDGVILADGPDAGTFLQGQLSQDVLLMPVGHARLAAFCSAKGRMQASFVVFKLSPERFALVCRQDLLAATLQRLSMFVMRAKVKLSNASEEFMCCGLLGSAGLSFFGTASDAPPWTAVVQNQAQLVALHPAGGLFRALWLAPAGSTPPEGPELSAQAWRLSEVLAGVAVVSAPVVDAYVPQMLNFESVGGVNFKKGCYPGQEVVARSQFRGTLKRRGYIAKSTAILQAGQEIFTAQDPEQACGSVAMSALALPADAQHMGSYAIVSLQTSSNQDLLHAGSASGPQLTLMPLPYPLLEDI